MEFAIGQDSSGGGRKGVPVQSFRFEELPKEFRAGGCDYLLQAVSLHAGAHYTSIQFFRGRYCTGITTASKAPMQACLLSPMTNWKYKGKTVSLILYVLKAT